MPRFADAYKSAWGLTEQPTTILGNLTSSMFGNIIRTNVAGRYVGMRWGRRNNVTDIGGFGVIFNTSNPHNVQSVCRFRVHTAVVGDSSVVWTNAFFHPMLRVPAMTTLTFMLCTNGVNLSYNDAQLSASFLTVGNLFYPQDNVPSGQRNGSITGSIPAYPGSAANGRRFALDVLFLPD
jgi:hypothetical protein